jgi:hypothetical protein
MVVFHDDSLERMKQHDPAILECVYLQHLKVDALPLETTDFMFCYEPDQAVFEAKCQELGSNKAILRWLGRGWANQPAERDSVIGLAKITTLHPKEE